MSTNKKFYTLLASLLFMHAVSKAQVSSMEMTLGINPALSVTGSGFGPRTTNHVVTYAEDALNNSNFISHSPTVTGTFALSNNYTGFTYGTGGLYPISTGLVFGAYPTTAQGGTIQQVDPLNSYDLLGTATGSGGPTNSMFATAASLAGSSIDAEGIAFGNDYNGAVQVFTAAQRMYDLGNPNTTASRYNYGTITITFNRYVTNPVIHVAGLGGCYRYLPTGQVDIPANYLSTYFSTELEYLGPGTMTLLAGNSFITVSGKNVLNNSATPNGGSTPNSGSFNNEGAATGSVRINAVINQISLRVWLRGSDASQFAWSAPQSAIQSATRNPLTGDSWYLAASFEKQQLITLPATGLNLTAALNGNDVQLKWKTASEMNSDRFIIERSSDGVNYSQIGVKQAAGYSTTTSNYTHVDPNMTANAYYYRVKLVDLDGKSSYSNVAIVRKSGGIKGIKSFPNPATDKVSIEFSNMKGNYIVSLFDITGRIVAAQTVNINNTVQYADVNRNSLQAGSYIIRVTSQDNVETFAQKITFQ